MLMAFQHLGSSWLLNPMQVLVLRRFAHTSQLKRPGLIRGSVCSLPFLSQLQLIPKSVLRVYAALFSAPHMKLVDILIESDNRHLTCQPWTACHLYEDCLERLCSIVPG